MSRDKVGKPAAPALPEWAGAAAMLIVAAVWGSSYSVVKLALVYQPVLSFIATRFILSTLVLLPFAWGALRRAPRFYLGTGLPLGGIVFAIFLCETFGAANTTASNAALLAGLNVLFTPLANRVVAGVRLDRGILGLAVLYIAGTACLTGGLADIRLGDVLFVGAALLRGFNVPLTKRLTQGQEVSTLAVTVVQLGTVAVGMTVLAWLHDGRSALSLPTAREYWVAVLFLAVICMGLAFYVQTHMTRVMSPVRVAFLLGTEPVFGVLSSMLLLGEVIGWRTALGGGLIVAAVFLGVRRDKQVLPAEPVETAAVT